MAQRHTAQPAGESQPDPRLICLQNPHPLPPQATVVKLCVHPSTLHSHNSPLSWRVHVRVSDEEAEVLRSARDTSKPRPQVSLILPPVLSLQPSHPFPKCSCSLCPKADSIGRGVFEEYISGEDLMADIDQKPWMCVSVGLRVPSRDANGGLDPQC